MARFIKAALALDSDDDEEVMEQSWREQMDGLRTRQEPQLYPSDKPPLRLAMPQTGFTGITQHSKLTPKSPSPMMSTAILEEDDSSEDYL